MGGRMTYGEQRYGDLRHAECLEAMRRGEHPADAPTMARFLQALVWRQDHLEARIERLEQTVYSQLRLSP